MLVTSIVSLPLYGSCGSTKGGHSSLFPRHSPLPVIKAGRSERLENQAKVIGSVDSHSCRPSGSDLYPPVVAISS